jgi:hypothetical protein
MWVHKCAEGKRVELMSFERNTSYSSGFNPVRVDGDVHQVSG